MALGLFSFDPRRAYTLRQPLNAAVRNDQAERHCSCPRTEIDPWQIDPKCRSHTFGWASQNRAALRRHARAAAAAALRRAALRPLRCWETAARNRSSRRRGLRRPSGFRCWRQRRCVSQRRFIRSAGSEVAAAEAPASPQAINRCLVVFGSSLTDRLCCIGGRRTAARSGRTRALTTPLTLSGVSWKPRTPAACDITDLLQQIFCGVAPAVSLCCYLIV